MKPLYVKSKNSIYMKIIHTLIQKDTLIKQLYGKIDILSKNYYTNIFVDLNQNTSIKMNYYIYIIVFGFPVLGIWEKKKLTVSNYFDYLYDGITEPVSFNTLSDYIKGVKNIDITNINTNQSLFDLTYSYIYANYSNLVEN